jgi:hypothetical protein
MQHRVQELAGTADERLALAVFLGARGFADHEPIGLLIAHAEDALSSCRVEGASGAADDFGAQRRPSCGQVAWRWLRACGRYLHDRRWRRPGCRWGAGHR